VGRFLSDARWGGSRNTHVLLEPPRRGPFLFPVFSLQKKNTPEKKGNYSDLDRAYKYALGFGALVKKEVKGRKNRFYILKYWKRQFRSFVGMIVTRNRRYHRVVMKGRKIGYKHYELK